MPKPNHARKRVLVSVLFNEQDGRCAYCDREMMSLDDFDLKAFLAEREANGLVPSVPNLYPTADHVKPVCEGGTWHISNLVAACWDCNHKKGGHRIPQELVQDRTRMVELFRTGKIKHYLRSLNAA